MKFDFTIGNPPYQKPSAGGNKTFMPPVYHLFLDRSYEIADRAEMIHPARFIFNNGFTPKAWNKKMLNDRHIKILHYAQDSAKIFPETGISGGIVITYRDANVTFDPISTFCVFIPEEELKSVLQKVLQHTGFIPFSGIISSERTCQFTDRMREEHPEYKLKLDRGREKNVGSNIFSKLPEIFFDLTLPTAKAGGFSVHPSQPIFIGLTRCP